MSFIVRKKKYKFAVKLTLEELSSVPYINGLLYAKVRQIDGGSFCSTSTREEVIDHCVKWGSKFDLECKMSANASNGVLNSCLLRISVRKEVNGGRTCQKLGFVDLDLAEFAGAGLTCKRCLLEGYSNTHHRSDNSTLKLLIEMTLLSGDPLFKRPTRGNSSFYAPLPAMDHHMTTESDILGQQQHVISNSSTKESLTDGVILLEDNDMIPAPIIGSSATPSSLMAMLNSSSNQLHTQIAAPSTPCLSLRKENQFDMGHSRNSSQQSKASVGYGSLPAHSRQGSTEAAAASSAESAVNRVDATRINAEDVIQELLDINLSQVTEEENPDDVGLEIYVSKDGTATLGSRQQGTGERNRVRKKNHTSKTVTERVNKPQCST